MEIFTIDFLEATCLRSPFSLLRGLARPAHQEWHTSALISVLLTLSNPTWEKAAMSCLIVRPFFSVHAATRWLIAAALVCAAPHVFAFNVFHVGGDAACDFNNIQQAVNASTDSDGNTIFVARNFTYSNQHVVINGRKVNILGGYATCSGTTVGDSTQITDTSQSVIAIRGNSVVYLANLDISGAAI
ncbi:MAG: hypothetical protein ABI748_13295, partial [Dokdonella sp.]